MGNHATSNSIFIYFTKLRSILIVLSFVISGCSTAAVHKPLEPGLVNQKHNIAVYSIIPNEEIISHFKTKRYVGTAGGQSVVGILLDLGTLAIDKSINAQRADRAEERISPLQEASADFDFGRNYWNELEPTISNATWFTVSKLYKRRKVSESEINQFTLPILILKTAYELSGDFQVLIVQTKASLYITTLESSDYFSFYTYYSDRIGRNDEKNEGAIALWAASNAAALRQEARAGIEQNMKMIQYELLNDPTNRNIKNGKAISFKLRSPISGSILDLKGVLIEQSEERILMRESGGNLFSISTGLKE